MERLTEFHNGIRGMPTRAVKDGYDRYSVFSLLADYENTELTPQEIITLNDFSQSQLAKLLEENCKLRQQHQLDIRELQDLSFALIDMHDDKEQWQRESISDKSKLGLLRIWLAEMNWIWMMLFVRLGNKLSRQN